MKQIVFVTPPDARHGFSLIGARQIVTTPEDLPKMLDDLVGDPANGALVIDERLIGEPARDRLRDAERRWPGLVVVLPAPARAAAPEDDYALRLVHRAVGYHLKVNP